MICGNFPAEETLFKYRSSSYLTEFFHDCYADYVHDGSSRKAWVADTRRTILAERQPIPKYALGDGAPSLPKSTPTNLRMEMLSYSASSTPGSLKLNHCCRK